MASSSSLIVSNASRRSPISLGGISIASTLMAAAALLLTACGSNSSAHTKATVPTGRTPAGDIPDTAIYITYQGTGYRISYVEGWTLRTGPGTSVTISDKDSSEQVLIAKTGSNLATYAGNDLQRLAVRRPVAVLTYSRSVSLAAGKALHAHYTTLSSRDPVTLKRVPVVVDRYYIGGPGRIAVITLSTPRGVDNVDAFRIIAHSFRWR